MTEHGRWCYEISQEFVDEYLEKADNSYISVTELYKDMRLWYGSIYGGRCSSAWHFRRYLQILGENFIKGYRIKENDESFNIDL